MITIWIFTIFILFQTNSLCNLRDCFIDFPWILCLGIYNYTSIFWRFFQIEPTICRITIICTGNCPINFSNNGILYIICFYKYFPILKWGQEINNSIIFLRSPNSKSTVSPILKEGLSSKNFSQQQFHPEPLELFHV